MTGGAGPFVVETAHQRSSGTTTLDFSPPAFTGRNETRSFNAAEDIRLAFAYADARRDPAEHDEIGTVVVSFVDDESIGTHYNPAPASGLIIHHSDADNDLVILHEYTHFLEDKISLLTPDGRVTLRDDRLIVTAGDDKREELIAGAGDWRRLAAERFGIDLDRG